MESAIIWAVVWGLLALLTSGIVGWIVGLAVGFIAVAIGNDEAWALTGLILGWAAGAAWFIFCAIQCVQNIIAIVNLS